MIEARPGGTFQAVVDGAPLGAPMGVHIEDFDGNTLVARVTAPDVVEVDPGIYAISTLVAPAAVGHYLVIWDNGDIPLDEGDVTQEELVVRTVPATPPGASEIELMRDAYNGSLPDLCTIFRRTRFPDGIGGYTYTWQPHLEDEPCRLGFPGGGESDVREASRVRLVDEETQMVWVRAKTDVIQEDRVLITGGALYDVNAVLRRGGWEIARRLRVVETEWQDDEPD